MVIVDGDRGSSRTGEVDWCNPRLHFGFQPAANTPKRQKRKKEEGKKRDRGHGDSGIAASPDCSMFCLFFSSGCHGAMLPWPCEIGVRCPQLVVPWPMGNYIWSLLLCARFSNILIVQLPGLMASQHLGGWDSGFTGVVRCLHYIVCTYIGIIMTIVGMMRWGGWHNLEGRRVVVLCCLVSCNRAPKVPFHFTETATERSWRTRRGEVRGQDA